MGVQIAFLRGVGHGAGHGPGTEVEMGALREALAEDGLPGARTHDETGNVVLCSDDPPAELARRIHRIIEERFQGDVFVIVRSHQDLAAVVALNPFGDAASDPESYLVVFLQEEVDQGEADGIAALASENERFAAVGRELYAYHGDGIFGSRLVDGIRSLGTPATARGWPTVTSVLKLADAVREEVLGRDEDKLGTRD